MKKLLYILFLLFTHSFVYSQFDTEHWFAPFADKTGGQNAEQYLYLSTNKTAPFVVEIYNNNVLYKSISISKGNPGIVPIDRALMISSDASNLFTPNKMGLHLVGEYKFFAHFRFSVSNHAEIITSKGKAGLGKDFYTYTPPNNNTASNANSTVGIVASEDNTTITLDHFNDNIVLSNGDSVNSTTVKNITLNKGESYILESYANTQNNLIGLNTLHIQSNNPISVTNGAFNNISPNRANNDVYMDQASPIERLGTEYISLKGNGNLDTQMEVLAIIATEDNTSFYVNGSSIPRILAKKGDYTIVPSSDYVSTNSSVDAYNIYIKSDKKIYVYQMLAGVDAGTGQGSANSYASGGMNILPQLACLLPNKIDEFANVNEIGYQSNFNVRLNIITEKGATIKINGTAASSINGPFAVQGTNDWETYVFPNVSGNIAIESTKAVTAGISGGSGAVGFGGYFAGFNSNPIISKGGDCDKGNITLEVDNTYTNYQWYLNGQPYTGDGANTYIIHPTESGDYYVHIEKQGCGTLDSPIFSFQRCPFKSSNSVEISNCNPTYTTNTPTFSVSTQTVDYSTVKITTPPTNGTVTINTTTGKITYTLTNLSALTDTFTYSFSSTDPKFPDTEYITVNINVNYLKVFGGETFTCIKPDKTGDFDLSKAVISNDTNITSIEYFENYNSLTKTFTNLISNFTSYNSLPKTIYAKVTNSYGCTDVAMIELKFYPIPNIDTVKFNSTLCDTDLDGLYEPDFDEISKTIVNNSSDFDIYYFDNSGYNFPALPKSWTYTTPTRVYVLVASKNGCTSATGFIDFKIGTKISVNDISGSVCDNDLNGKEDTKISNFLPALTNGTSYYYYDTLAKAQEAKSGTTIPDEQIITATTTFYIRAENPLFCPNVFALQIVFNQPETSSKIHDLTICKNTTTTIDAGTNFIYYKWSNGTEGQFAKEAEYGVGTHFVELTSQNGCVYKQTFTISEAEDPTFDSVLELGNSITVNISGGKPPYEYSLDNINWQTSNVFNNLKRGLQVVYVRDSYKCTPIEYEFLIFNQINAITPNGDGINDVLDYSDLKVKKDVKILIFDRYGRKVYSNEKQSTYIWDGTSNGRVLPTGTYWYILEWTEPDNGAKLSFKDWILIKDRK